MQSGFKGAHTERERERESSQCIVFKGNIERLVKTRDLELDLFCEVVLAVSHCFFLVPNDRSRSLYVLIFFPSILILISLKQPSLVGYKDMHKSTYYL
jgi:hypothetical protein